MEDQKQETPKIFVYVYKKESGDVSFQIGGHDIEVLGLLEFADFFMKKKMTDALKIQDSVEPKVV